MNEDVTAAAHGASPALRAQEERIHDVGYINDDEEHILLGFMNPAILNAGAGFVQVAVKVESARRLCGLLETFLELHDSKPRGLSAGEEPKG